jgi:hypothetical protein
MKHYCTIKLGRDDPDPKTLIQGEVVEYHANGMVTVYLGYWSTVGEVTLQGWPIVPVNDPQYEGRLEDEY